MTTFALITEGITDQAILENILDCLTDGKAITRALRPLRDETDKKRVAENEFSNWELVFEYLGSEEILNAIQTSDFIVIQVDADQCEHPNFGVSLSQEGSPKTIEKIIEDCIAVIRANLHPQFPAADLDRLLFAVPVLSSECWLIALFDPTHTHTRKTVNACVNRLLPLLARKKVRYKKEYETYSDLSKHFRNKKTLDATANKTPCLKAFIDHAAIAIAT